ncbi:MAG: leucyl aminopeptidase [Candidatus Dadabacteria bacterium]|nr:leucyl aminopeptidase [Candidatus Dadabacteria bacterium]
MEFRLNEASALNIKCSVLVVGKFEDQDFNGELAQVDKKLGGELSKICSEGDFKGEVGTSLLVSTLSKIKAERVLVAGLGKRKKLTADVLRKTGISVSKKVKPFSKKLVYALGIPLKKDNFSALIEGTLLGTYEFTKYKSDNKKANGIESVDIVCEVADSNRFDKELGYAELISDATNFTRDLVNEPPVYLNPTRLATIAEEIAGENNLKLTILDKEDMLKRRMGGLLAVNKGSTEPPKFIHFTYEPKRKSGKSIAIVGKGITFDSGGLSLKPPDSMRTMKMDMAGAGVVMGVMKAISKINPPYRVHGLIPSTENMTGGGAYKVDDVIRAMNGKTIEVVNTDAEGRIVLADALSYAVELGVGEIVDLATLTGACIVGLGAHTAGIMGNNENLLNKIKKAAALAGEKVWELPLDEDLRKDIDSNIADIKNAGSRWGGAITAAMFLENFVSGKPWAHIDIAGPAFNDKGGRYSPKGGTGFGVRMIIRYLLLS